MSFLSPEGEQAGCLELSYEYCDSVAGAAAFLHVDM